MSTVIHIIDSNCNYRDGTVYQDYDCTLNQTDIRTNKNKFYIMQIIEKGNSFYLFIRYGRVGERGVIKHTPFNTGGSAADAFVKQFKSKTSNTWGTPFVPKKGKYYLCEMDYEDVIKNPKTVDLSEADAADKKAPAVCKLDPLVQDFLRLVSDTKEMNHTMVELDIDTKKCPLGKLSQSQIDKAYSILNKILTALNDTTLSNVDRENIVMDFSSEYYTLIPYVCGRGSRPPVINSKETVQKYTETLDELSNITVAAKIVKDSSDSNTYDCHPLDAVYNSINTDIKAVERNSKTWKIIENYVYKTHAPTHSNYTVELQEIFEIQRKGEKEVYQKEVQGLDNKQLLWHGTRLTNYISILKNGLLLRPDVIPGTYISGKMFGYGIYAANSFSKSFNYTGADKRNPTACLFLGEFALGNTSKRLTSDYYVSKDKLKQLGCHSTHGLGQNTPAGFDIMDDGVIVPNGQIGKSNVQGAGLLYDEFIVYDQNQLNLRFIVKVKGNFKY
jgi:predicted DNA-binding WGR domain protein